MGSWRRLMVLGLLTGLFAASCVITSGDDDDNDSDDTTTTGGSDESTGGSTTGGGGASFGGSPVTGGTGGTEECSLEGAAGLNDCEACIRDNCCPEYDACTGDCADEFEAAQKCILEKVEEYGEAITADDVQECVDGSAVDGFYITQEMHDLMYCISTNRTCAEACTGTYDPYAVSAGGAGGAAGAPGEGGAGGGD